MADEINETAPLFPANFLPKKFCITGKGNNETNGLLGTLSIHIAQGNFVTCG
jgi:hypothetical protein